MKTVCVVEGNLRERKGYLDDIKESLANFELFVFDKEDHYDYVSQIVTELSCFGERRLFIIKELPQIKIKSKKEGGVTKSQIRTKVMNSFKKLFPAIPAGNIVVFDNIGISSVSFLKEVKKYGKVQQFKQRVSKSKASSAIVNYFRRRKITCSGGIAELVANSLNFMGDDVDVDKLELLILQLYNYVYSKSSITKNDVHAICSTSKEFVVWSLYNILDEGGDNKYGEAFSLVISFLENTRYFQYEATMLLQSMLWRYGLVLMIKSGINNGISTEDIADKISNIRKLKSEGRAQKIRMSPKEDKPEYSVKMVRNVIGRSVVSCYTLNELLSIYYVISKSLVKIRSGCTISEITTFLQMVLLTICGELGINAARDGILDHKKMLREAG